MIFRSHAGRRSRRPALWLPALLATMAIWLVYSWPLPKVVLSGVPFAAHTTGKSYERMAPGDHLQLMYHFWLAADMIAGHTPLFHNLYEFNTGNDADRYEPGPYYAPFSLFYAIGSWIAGRAFGWNFAGFVSLWLTYGLTWMLTRRYCGNRWIAAAAALPALILPFRWYALLGGSPMGFAAMWIPAIILGVDVAVRDNRPAGGLLAGLSVLFASFGDTHVFFFGVLAIPGWCVFAFLSKPSFRWNRFEDYGRLALSLLPVLILVAAAYWLKHLTSHDLSESTMGKGRGLREVMNFSPEWKGFYSRAELPFSNLIYVGYVAPAALALGALVLLGRVEWRRPATWRNAALLILCIAVGTVIVLLALGPRGPHGSRMLLLVRRLIPPYAMIRQTAKIYCLMPTVLAVGMALALGALATIRKTRGWQAWVLIAAAVLLLADYRSRIRPGICLLQNAQQAYAAAANDAAARHRTPRALIVALWPGDSHFTSLYQYYASLYRIRMVNGYSPVVKKDYVERTFRRFESVNQGYLSDDQIEELAGKGIDYILLHADLFPEKVSPFPVAFTIKNLLNNPRLQLLANEQCVWAFRVRPAPDSRPAFASRWTTFFPARRWEAEKCRHGNAPVGKDASAGSDGYVSLPPDGAVLDVPDVKTVWSPGLRYMARVRGPATMGGRIEANGVSRALPETAVNSPDWTWVEIPAPETNGYAAFALHVQSVSGTLAVDSLLLAAGTWEWALEPGKGVTIPAPCFFHAGHVRLDDDSVSFAAGGRDGIMLYGPKMPLTEGRYQCEFMFASPAAPGARLGELSLNRGESTEFGHIPVISGRPAVFTFQQTPNLPMHLVFTFSGGNDVTVQDVRLTRQE